MSVLWGQLDSRICTLGVLIWMAICSLHFRFYNALGVGPLKTGLFFISSVYSEKYLPGMYCTTMLVIQERHSCRKYREKEEVPVYTISPTALQGLNVKRNMAAVKSFSNWNYLTFVLAGKVFFHNLILNTDAVLSQIPNILGVWIIPTYMAWNTLHLENFCISIRINIIISSSFEIYSYISCMNKVGEYYFCCLGFTFQLFKSHTNVPKSVVMPYARKVRNNCKARSWTETLGQCQFFACFFRRWSLSLSFQKRFRKMKPHRLSLHKVSRLDCD